MANIIALDPNTPPEYCVCMSNGLTAVFIDVLSLSGSQLARTAEEKRLIVWLSQKDQSKVGGGTVGFDLCEMPWNPATFAENKAFLLNAAAEAKNRLGWELLDYSPNEEMLFPRLDQFARLISQMEITDILPEPLAEWLRDEKEDYPLSPDFPKCPKHHTFLTIFGCHLCNN